MFLKALTLKGFKSFADATTIQLEPGVTVVVGPNGSGKSNVVDAVAWVLGAQAPSAVRSQKMDDVIFAGTARRPALGRAEVALTIDNSAGLLPIEFTEVTVSRTLFRTGESEYAINGVPCRLLDVQELLSDAGVGRQQHVIVSQGQIDAVLNARPEDRRSIIEEAAGVLKFRKRKEKAERRLEATDASLLRVQDLLREVRRQLRPLERQAEAARRHGELVAQLQAVQVYLAGREIASLRTRLTAAAGARMAVAARERELRAELAALDTAVLAAESELTARGDHDIGDEMVRVEHLRERARGIAAVIAERRRSMERERGQLMDSGVVANLEADAGRLRAELDDAHAALAGLDPQADELAADEEAFTARRRNSLAGLDAPPTANTAVSAVAEVRGELRSLRRASDRADGELRRMTRRVDGLTQRVAALDGDVERLRAECASAADAEVPLVAEVEAAEARCAAAQAALDAATEASRRADDELSRWTARAEALQQARESARARAGAEHLAGVDGVLGTLLDVIEVDDGWEPAVEAAFGEALEAVVVESPDAGRRALQSLAAADVHAAVLALGAGGGRAPAGDERRAVRPHVRTRHPGVGALLDRLLAGTVRIATWADAVDVALAHPEVVVVTDAGDRFGPRGWRLGAAGGGATAAALDEARQRAAHAAAAADTARRAIGTAASERTASRRAIDEISLRLDRHDAAFSASSEALARTQGERRDAYTELRALCAQVATAGERAAAEHARITELERMLPALEADEAAELHAARVQRDTRAELDRQAAELSGRRKELEVRTAALLARQSVLTGRLEENERRLEVNTEARALARHRREDVGRVLDALGRLAAFVEAHRAVIEARHHELAELRRKQSDEVRSIAQRLDACRRQRATAENDLDETRERSRRAEVEDAELKLRLETTVEALRRDHDIEPEAAEAAPAPALPEGVNATAHQRELERRLRLLGPINPLALEEFNELRERHTFLEGQLEDVRETRRELMRVIRAVDLEIQTVFASAFADVATHFAALFSSLFPGGAGKLLLTDPDDLLDTGIEVEAKPSGKNVKKLSLLSGGERALTALAFLFAVFRSRPSPFYVMDEVEAALDDVNLHRFLALIHEFRQEAQLLIVSHQKRTMEAGDCLLGVTMHPGGSSKVVTERVSTPA